MAEIKIQFGAYDTAIADLQKLQERCTEAQGKIKKLKFYAGLRVNINDATVKNKQEYGSAKSTGTCALSCVNAAQSLFEASECISRLLGATETFLTNAKQSYRAMDEQTARELAK